MGGDDVEEMAGVVFVVFHVGRIGQGEVIAGDFARRVERAVENPDQRMEPEEREGGPGDPGALAVVSLNVSQLVPNDMAELFERPARGRPGKSEGVFSQPPGHGHGVVIEEDQKGCFLKAQAG